MSVPVDIPVSPNNGGGGGGGGVYMQAPTGDIINNLPVATLISTEGQPMTGAASTAGIHHHPTPTAPAYHSSSGPAIPTAPPTNINNSNSNTTNNFITDEDLTRFPMMMRECPSCRTPSRTRATTAPSWQTWTASGAMCFLFWPLSWVPLVLDNCKKTEHYCVTCGAKVGQVRKESGTTNNLFLEYN